MRPVEHTKNSSGLRASISATNSHMRRASRSNMTSLLELNGVSVGDNLKNEIFIISSKRLMQRVVEKLNLDVDYLIDEGLHHVPLYKDERPVEIIFQSPYTEEMAAKTKQASLNFDVKKKNLKRLKKFIKRRLNYWMNAVKLYERNGEKISEKILNYWMNGIYRQGDLAVCLI